MPFQNNYANLVSEKSEAHTRLIRDYDGTNPDFDYIVIGSGIGGGVVADELADRNAGKRILVVDAGSFVYPTHAYNICRFDNSDVAAHFGVDNFQQAETPQRFIGGKPQLVFGGRSIFWSGLIPEPQDWELDFFPDAVRTDLKGGFLNLAGERMNASRSLGDKARQLAVHFRNSPLGQDFVIHETPRALHQPYLLADGTPATQFFVEPTGVFNTAELLINQTGLTRPTLNLNGAGLFVKLNSFVEAVNSVPHDWYEVRTTNTVTGEQRSFYTPRVIIAAGSTESPKLINRSSVFHTLPADIRQLVGFGLTDHPVSAESQAYVTSAGNPRIPISPDEHAKIVFYSSRTIAKSQVSAGHEVDGAFDVPVEGVGLRLERLALTPGVEYPQHAHGRAQQGREALGQPRPAAHVPVLVPPPVLLEVQAVLHRPVPANEPEQRGGGHHGRVETGGEVPRLARPGAVGPSGLPVHPHDRPQAGDVQRLAGVVRRRRVAPDPPGLDRPAFFPRAVALADAGVASANAARIVSCRSGWLSLTAST
ncbi:hypothetical protein [Urbifossiella limnaea]|uniref:GMC family oxidoreductase n=1 Tax=Urbifossiella limnaea TaxID=2528023 RepID=A0A517XVF2_9BACT|nr:hypothetical protein ETAA1_34570 [Urbifossiella limnaea]